ncbi:MAG TPA: twin-arginine translocase TatA/TatE family subunit [Geminicoccus sp.]|jgi:sec-independent protein translocase protein TatA|uniref:twin-arginine translocase TatA/TatE family subunit n=1 Tax=Geminicoccus TaxID=489140 RepID=UPI00168A3FDA|nr:MULTISPECIES: twin-arginine translocase TatA/TatE family subunit [Geminicoccus]HWL68010.1 twin-arginine translocase TatA/TatE family subunit [Geminicoccus sp.]
MGSFSAWHWIVVLVIVLIVFGAGRLPKVMGDLASGIKTFKKGMQDDPAVTKADDVPAPAHENTADKRPV